MSVRLLNNSTVYPTTWEDALEREERGWGTRQPRLKLSSPVYQILTLDKLLSLSVPQFLHLSNGIIAEVYMSLAEYKVGLYEALTTYSASYNVCWIKMSKLIFYLCVMVGGGILITDTAEPWTHCWSQVVFSTCKGPVYELSTYLLGLLTSGFRIRAICSEARCTLGGIVFWATSSPKLKSTKSPQRSEKIWLLHTFRDSQESAAADPRQWKVP